MFHVKQSPHQHRHRRRHGHQPEERSSISSLQLCPRDPRPPAQRHTMVTASQRARNAPSGADPWTSPGLVTRGRAAPSVPPQRSHQNAPYIPRCSRYAHDACQPVLPSDAYSNRSPPPVRDRQASSSPHPESAQHSGNAPRKTPDVITAQSGSTMDSSAPLTSIHRSTFLSHRTPFLCHRRGFL